jgi:hypothetical protein
MLLRDEQFLKPPGTPAYNINSVDAFWCVPIPSEQLQYA